MSHIDFSGQIDGFAAMKKAELTWDVWKFEHEPRQAGAFELAEKACHVTIFSTFLHISPAFS